MITDLEKIKITLGVTGNYLDQTLTGYAEEVEDFLINAGVKPQNITDGIVTRGVIDMWNYGAGEGMLSDYFIQRAKQLSYK